MNPHLAAFERRTDLHFFEWAAVRGNDHYAVIRMHTYPGIRWAIVSALTGQIVRMTAGAFYDGVPEHPEGAVAWARAAAKQDAERVEQWIEEFTLP